VDEAIRGPRRQYGTTAPRRRTVAHDRSYEEVRGLVLLLAEQPIGRDAAEKLKRIVIRADRA
jgi:hypothetical protein